MSSIENYLRHLLAFLTLCLVTACVQQPASQQPTLRVMTSGGFASSYDDLAPRFTSAHRITPMAIYGSSMGGAPDSIPLRLARAEEADIVIMARSSLDDLAAKGLVDRASITDLARSEIGMAIKAGAPVLSISTPPALIKALLSATSIGYSASASGRYLSNDLFPNLEIYPQIRAKLVRIESERVAAVVARGEVEIGFQQVSEILPIKGIVFVGKIPAEYQLTTTFSAAIVSKSRKKREAKCLIAYFASPQGSETMRIAGLDPIAGHRAK
jgi:molybdate transport system substrate-binding protein